jgi:two-component system, cell cycle response regulator
MTMGSGRPGGEALNVLCADDSATVLQRVARFVEELGHRSLIACDGEEAWRMFEANGEIDAIISDWVMPGTDGLELCRRVRQLDGRPYTYFLLLTGISGKPQVTEAMRAGVDDYLVKPFERADLEARLITAARLRGLHLNLARKQAELEALNGRLFDQARTDPLTHLGNRLRLREDLEALHARARRYGQRYAVAMFDVDWFKAYNDHYGHAAGDQALRTVARIIRHQLRGGDTAYRYGGEEFVVLLAGQTSAKAKIAAERLRRAVEGLQTPHLASPLQVLTISGGVAGLPEEMGRALEPPLAEADQALYVAKERGRNQVRAFEDAA